MLHRWIRLSHKKSEKWKDFFWWSSDHWSVILVRISPWLESHLEKKHQKDFIQDTAFSYMSAKIIHCTCGLGYLLAHCVQNTICAIICTIRFWYGCGGYTPGRPKCGCTLLLVPYTCQDCECKRKVNFMDNMQKYTIPSAGQVPNQCKVWKLLLQGIWEATHG